MSDLLPYLREKENTVRNLKKNVKGQNSLNLSISDYEAHRIVNDRIQVEENTYEGYRRVFFEFIDFLNANFAS